MRSLQRPTGLTRTLTALALWVVMCASVTPIAIALPLPSEADVADEGVEATTVSMASFSDSWPSELHTADRDGEIGDGDSWFSTVASLTDLARERALLNEAFGFDDWGDFEEWESWADRDFGLTDFGDAAGGSPNFDIPPVALEAYRNAEALASTIAPSCQVRWSVLAGIGWVESNHGRHGGAGMDAAGNVAPRIIGPPLDGSPGVREIRDSDGGQWDGDRVFDRAVGPMQFIPSSWRVYGRDGNGDGVRDPHNMFDAALGAAAHLCTVSPGDYSNRGDLARALFGYNRSMEYVGVVLARIDAYDNNIPDGSQVAGAFGGFGGFGSFDDSGYTPPPPQPRPKAQQPAPPKTVTAPPPKTTPAKPKPKPKPKPTTPPTEPPTEQPTDPPTDKPTDPPTEEPTDPPPPPCKPTAPITATFGALITAANAGDAAGMRAQLEGFSGDSVIANFTARKQAGQTFTVTSVTPGEMKAGQPTYPFSYAVALGGEHGAIEGGGTASCTSGKITSLTVPGFTPPTEEPGGGENGGSEGGGGTEPTPEPEPQPAP